jgi:DNA-binding MarR family transcriptional regulator
MTTSSMERSRTGAVQSLFDGLQQLSGALRSRSRDSGHAVRELSRGDLVTLGVVARQQSIRSGRIAQTLGVDPSVVSRQLASLERLGFVARCVDPADRRAELISATSLGREQLQQARAAMCDELAVRLGAWDPDTIHHAATVVRDLAGLLNDTPTDTADTIITEDSKDAHA